MSTARPIVLLAHESAEMRAFLAEQLPEPCQVRAAADKKAALQALRREGPDLVVLDNGLEKTRALCREATQEPSEVPVVLLAGGAAKEEISPKPAAEKPRPEKPARKESAAEDSAAAGVWAEKIPEEILEKPFGPEAFRRRVKRHLPSGSTDRPGRADLAERACQVIERRLADPDLTVGEMAGALGVSARHLTRRLKAAVGKTPAALLRARRIERARQKLEAGPETIAEVARAVGFRSPSHFSQVFRKQVGSTPSAYREEHASGSG